jgi:hypothetical protein
VFSINPSSSEDLSQYESPQSKEGNSWMSFSSLEGLFFMELVGLKARDGD